MKILIIEDNPRKYQSTVEYVEKIMPTALTTWCSNAMYGINELLDNHYDFAIIDMQMPLRDGDSIDRQAGILVLGYIDNEKPKNPDMKFCINSSSKDTLEVLQINGYKDVDFILNNSMYNCTESFRKFLTKE